MNYIKKIHWLYYTGGLQVSAGEYSSISSKHLHIKRAASVH